MSIDFKNQFLSKSKATQISVAFFIFIMSLFAFPFPHFDSFGAKELESLKISTVNLLLTKNRIQAVQNIVAAGNMTTATEFKKILFSMQENALELFLNQNSQDFFEISASQMLQKTRLAEKNIQKCLELEPDNLYCRWQYLKILNLKNDPQFRILADIFITDTENFPEFGSLALSLSPNAIPRTDSQINLQKTHPHLFLILEFERSMRVQNYSLSKETLEKLTRLEPDYPDLAFMRAQLMVFSQEESATEKDQRILIDIYKKTCSSLRAELTRKYFYDINLCHRSL